MTSISITLCLQIVNFFIAYRILHIYIFKPAFMLLDAQDQELEMTQSAITRSQNSINDVRHSMKRYWESFSATIMQKMPTFRRSTDQVSTHHKQALLDTQIPDLSQQEKKKIKDMIINSLSKSDI